MDLKKPYKKIPLRCKGFEAHMPDKHYFQAKS